MKKIAYLLISFSSFLAMEIEENHIFNNGDSDSSSGRESRVVTDRTNKVIINKLLNTGELRHLVIPRKDEMESLNLIYGLIDSRCLTSEDKDQLSLRRKKVRGWLFSAYNKRYSAPLYIKVKQHAKPWLLSRLCCLCLHLEEKNEIAEMRWRESLFERELELLNALPLDE